MGTTFDYNYTQFDDLSVALINDYVLYLQDDILTKVDRSTMSASLEGREPFLDHRIIEFVATLPNEFKRTNKSKFILKDIVHDYVPKDLMEREKSGFSIPLNSWLATDLSHMINENLSISNIKNIDLFNFKTVEKIKNSFFRNGQDFDNMLWKLIQFQLWHSKWMN